MQSTSKWRHNWKDSFIYALHHFVARRGQVKEMRSDNGTNLVYYHAFKWHEWSGSPYPIALAAAEDSTKLTTGTLPDRWQLCMQKMEAGPIHEWPILEALDPRVLASTLEKTEMEPPIMELHPRRCRTTSQHLGDPGWWEGSSRLQRMRMEWSARFESRQKLMSSRGQ